MDTAASLLEHLGSCPKALGWLGGYPATPTGQYQAWLECARGDWMLWLAGKVGVDQRLLVLAACDCAEAALSHEPYVEERTRLAIKVARAWAQGNASVDDVTFAARAAYPTTNVCPADAAYAAIYAAYACSYASDASYAAAYSAHAYSVYASADDAHAKCARLVRRRIPWRLVRDGIREITKEAN